MSKSNNNNNPLPPLPPLKGSSKGVKRCGQPPGSKNQSRKEKYKRIRRDTAGANLVFESAFGHIPAVEPPVIAEADEVEAAAVTVVNEDANNNFGVHMTGRDDDDDDDDEIENEIYDANEGDIWFDSPDLYDIKELIELLTEDPGIEVEHEAHDEVKQLKKDYIGKTLKTSYCYSIVKFLFYIYKFEKYLMHKSWIKILGT